VTMTETCLFAKHNYLVDSVIKILGPDWFKKNIVCFHFLFSVLIIKMSSLLHCFLSLMSYIGNSENNIFVVQNFEYRKQGDIFFN
jgi:hypothetical protein